MILLIIRWEICRRPTDRREVINRAYLEINVIKCCAQLQTMDCILKKIVCFFMFILTKSCKNQIKIFNFVSLLFQTKAKMST